MMCRRRRELACFWSEAYHAYACSETSNQPWIGRPLIAGRFLSCRVISRPTTIFPFGYGNLSKSGCPRLRSNGKSSMANPALPPDFKEFLRLLNAHRVDYLIVGGYAVGFHGHPRATADIDIWIPMRTETATALV